MIVRLQTVVIHFGLPITLLLLLIVEQQYVMRGIQFFESNPAIAAIGAGALVLLSLGLEFILEYIKTRPEYQPELPPYGIGSENPTLQRWEAVWQAAMSAPRLRYKKLLHTVLFTIATSALLAVFKDDLFSAEGTWSEVIAGTLTHHSLTGIIRWFSGGMTVLVVIVAAHALGQFIAGRYVEHHSKVQLAGIQERGEDRSSTSLSTRLRYGNFPGHSCKRRR